MNREWRARDCLLRCVYDRTKNQKGNESGNFQITLDEMVAYSTEPDGPYTLKELNSASYFLIDQGFVRGSRMGVEKNIANLTLESKGADYVNRALSVSSYQEGGPSIHVFSSGDNAQIGFNNESLVQNQLAPRNEGTALKPL